ncbi:MAG: tRNA(Ile)-lysidine synthase [candidate division TM6 bacterium GW2011_GWE2_41_16]|nr:MAG: tRNA(Ile)-lysidine synthase [candidate division TM6 bacterium GW2011_GWE2_41_16]
MFVKLELLPKNARIVVGFSGGADSRALLDILVHHAQENHWYIIAAYLDHQWRAESATEALWCKQVAEHYHIPYQTMTLQHVVEQTKILPSSTHSKESYARSVRHAFYALVADKHMAEYIALAHHQGDQEETFFIRLIRGSGLEGLCAIQETSRLHSANFIRLYTPDITNNAIGLHNQKTFCACKNGPCHNLLVVRPLLHVTKQELVTYNNEHNLTWLEDPTNQDLSILRNCIRKTVLPSLHACDDRFGKSFQRTLQHLQEAQDYIDFCTTQTLQSITTTDTQQCRWIDIRTLLLLHPTLQHSVIIAWFSREKISFVPSKAFFNEIMRFFKQRTSGSHQLGLDWKISCAQNKATITSGCISGLCPRPARP